MALNYLPTIKPRHLLAALALAVAIPAFAEEWISLFDGKTMTGWKNPYEWGQIEVVNGEIHLTGEKKFFVVTEKTYGDFIFEGDILLPEGQANSDFMFRAHVEKSKFFVNGVLTTDVEDDKDAKGVIAIQHHGEKGQTYKFRNLRIQELK